MDSQSANIENFAMHSWQESISADEQQRALQALENSKLLFFEQLAFVLSEQEKAFLSTELADPNTKNVNFNIHTGQLRGCLLQDESRKQLQQMIERFADYAKQLVWRLFPQYTNELTMGKTSYRPIEAQGRKSSSRKDDNRLHVDAFPSMPVGQMRILRVFSNVNPDAKPRVWNIGESFQQVANRFMPQASHPIVGSHWLLKQLKITKSKRSNYDHYMLQIHDRMKGDDDYQDNVAKEQLALPSNSTWMVFTDSVSHAVLSGQYLLEQTFYLPYTAMQHPELAPQAILQQMSPTRVGKI